MGCLIVYAGVVLVITGLAIILAESLGIRLGRLPGDIRIQGRRGGFYFPIVTCILISIVLSLIFSLFGRR